MRRLVLAAFAVAAASAAMAQDYSPDQERYCTGDAMRLCSHEIPDVTRITACMEYYREQLSPACKAVFGPASKASVQPVRSRKTRRPE